jgi:hypothetical protein
MYPDSLDQSNPSAAERQLYHALRKQLGDDWVVFHGLQWVNEKEKRKASDADFVVLHPKHGLVCIEAKSGTMEHRDGRWYQQGEARKTDPFEQANRSMHELAKRIKDQTGISIRYAHGVAFPAVTQIAGVGPLNAHPSMAILSPDMKELEAAVVRMFEGVGQPRELDATKFEQVVDNLRAGFGLIETLHGRAIQQGHTLERLTEQQTLLLEVLGNRNRALIRGEAGSGKTELCVRQSVRLAEAIEDARVLVLTFNEPIAGELARRIGELSDRVEVVHFHGLARRYLEAAGVDWTPPTEPRDAVDDFYNFQIPEQFLAAVQQSADRYDAILVDEGQDFWDHWWEVVLQLLRDPQSGHLFIYFDPNQSIYGNEAGFPIEEEPIVLPTNCRSTRQIWEKCYAIRGVTNPKLRGDEPVGSEPRVLYSSSSADERALLQQELTRLVKDGDFRTDQVVVIGRLPFRSRSWPMTLFWASSKSRRREQIPSVPGRCAT